MGGRERGYLGQQKPTTAAAAPESFPEPNTPPPPVQRPSSPAPALPAHLLLLVLGQQEALVPLLLESSELLVELFLLGLVAGQQLFSLLRQAVQHLLPLSFQLPPQSLLHRRSKS